MDGNIRVDNTVTRFVQHDLQSQLRRRSRTEIVECVLLLLGICCGVVLPSAGISMGTKEHVLRPTLTTCTETGLRGLRCAANVPTLRVT